MVEELDQAPDIFTIFSLTFLYLYFPCDAKKKKKKKRIEMSVRSIFFLSLVSVVLLDTTQEEKLEWTKYPFGAEANTPGVSFAVVAIPRPPRGLVKRARGAKRKKTGRFFAAEAEMVRVSAGTRRTMDAARRQEEHGSGRGGRGIRSTLWSRCARHTWAPAGRCALSPAPCLFFSC